MEIPVNNSDKKLIVDDEDYKRCAYHSWQLASGQQIIYACIDGNTITIGRFILNYDEDLEVDHIDRDPFNNKKSNLRLATRSENMMNTRMRNDNSSGFRGVSWNKKSQNWEAYIHIGYKLNLGRFNTAKEAALAYNRAARKYYREFAYQNEI